MWSSIGFWREHINEAAVKLNRANAILYKVREFVSTDTLRSICFAIFDLHLKYGNLVWGQDLNAIKRVLQKCSSEKDTKINEFQT